VSRVNDELVATWGNLVNRVVSMTHRYFEGVVPDAGARSDEDLAVVAGVDAVIAETGEHLEARRLRAGLQRAMSGAQALNVYLNDRQPWKTAKTDLAVTAATLVTALEAIAGLAVALDPYLPFTSPRVLATLGVDVRPATWTRPEIAPGTVLAPPEPLFTKIESLDEDE